MTRTVARYDEATGGATGRATRGATGGEGAAAGTAAVLRRNPRPEERPEDDSVFRRLLGEAGWRRLHPEVRRRFGAEAEATRHYAGFMSEVRCGGPTTRRRARRR